MKTAKINLYSFEELTNEAKETAIYEALNILDSEPIECENESGEMVNEYVEHTEEYAKEFILINDYLFFKNGKLAYTITYCGKHPKAGQSELILNGETVKI